MVLDSWGSPKPFLNKKIKNYEISFGKWQKYDKFLTKSSKNCKNMIKSKHI